MAEKGRKAKVRICGMCGGRMSPYWVRAQILRCESCSLLSRSRIPTAEELRELYSAGWKRPGENRSLTGGTDRRLADRFVQCLVESLGLESLQGRRILEFGAGTGAMMKALETAGAEVYGVDPFGYSLLKQEGLNAFRDLSDLPAGICFDGIFSIDVVEHLSEPWSIVQKLKDLLSLHGWIYVSTPNAAGISARLARSNWRELKKRGHIVFFRPDSLEFLLRKCGFAIYRRLCWRIDYGKGRLRGLPDSLLRALKLDGELRYLAFPSATES
jgi:2-polyprenyl-3-methyl-5-hydroxy-6-metoxy-1,4-benzoquinol methylase